MATGMATAFFSNGTSVDFEFDDIDQTEKSVDVILDDTVTHQFFYAHLTHISLVHDKPEKKCTENLTFTCTDSCVTNVTPQSIGVGSTVIVQAAGHPWNGAKRTVRSALDANMFVVGKLGEPYDKIFHGSQLRYVPKSSGE